MCINISQDCSLTCSIFADTLTCAIHNHAIYRASITRYYNYESNIKLFTF